MADSTGQPEQARAPEFLITQHDQDGSPNHNTLVVEENPFPLPHTRFPSASLGVRGLPDPVNSTFRQKRQSLTPISTTPDIFPTPKALTRSKSLLAEPERAPTSNSLVRAFTRSSNVEQNIPLQSCCRPKAKYHVPYEPKHCQRDRTNLDLIVVYMFHGDKSDAHETFFECPESGSESQERQLLQVTSFSTTTDGGILGSEPKNATSKAQEQAGSTSAASQRDARPRTTNWLKHRHMLPKVLPFSRVLCVGYDLSTVPKDQRISFEWCSDELMRILDKERSHCPTRPAIFIGHGYGCRIIQWTVRRTQSIQNDHPLKGRCAGVMFHHAPSDDADPTVSELGFAAEKYTNDLSTAPNGKPASKESPPKLGSAMQEHSILHHFLQHGPLGKDSARAMRFSNTNDRTFKLISTKVVEWSETHQLLHAVEETDFAEVQRLIDSGIDINQRKSATLMTALHVACQTAKSKSHDIDLLVDRGNADVSLKDSFGKTALHYAVERRPPDVAIVRVLLEAGAQTSVADMKGITPLDLADPAKGRQKIQNLLIKRPLVQGPSAGKGVVTPTQPHSQLAKDACQAFQMAATEMYLDRGTWTEKHVPRHFSIQEAIYGQTPLQELLDNTRSSGIKDDLICRWYHIPANNMAWVEDLFRNRFKINPTVWSELFRDSEWPHGRCIIPHASRFTAESEGSKEEVLAICMPYVSYEDNVRQKSVSDTVNEAPAEENALPRRIYRLWDLEKKRSQRRFDTSSTLPLPSTSRQHSRTSVSSTGKRSRQSQRSSPTTISKWLDSDDQSPTQTPSPVDSASDSDSHAMSSVTRPSTSTTMSKEEEAHMKAYLHHQPPLHARRTLDQYYYYMLRDTRERDADQVVTRWARDELNHIRHNILMVDQLWLWVVKGKDGQPDRVVSSFPERQGFESESLDDLQRNVLNSDTRKRKPISSTSELCSRIIATCSDVFGWSQEAELVRFLHFFEATVGRVGDREIRLLKKFRLRSEKLYKLSKRHFHYAEMRDQLLIDMLDITLQTELLEEAKDVRDEINIILHVLGEQRRVLKSEVVVSFLGPGNSNVPEVYTGPTCAEPLRLINQAIGDFEKMEKQMKEIQDGLNHLLDLQQKQATVWEARSTREGARATSKQGNVMVIFTMVTIIFLPLSFMASFFALDIAEYPADDKGQTNWPLHRICTLLFGISFGVIIPFIALAFATDFLFAMYSWFKNGWLIPVTVGILSVLAKVANRPGKATIAKWVGQLESRQHAYYEAILQPATKARQQQFSGSPTLEKVPSQSLPSQAGSGEDSLSDIEQDSRRTKFIKRLRRRRFKRSAEERV